MSSTSRYKNLDIKNITRSRNLSIIDIFKCKKHLVSLKEWISDESDLIKCLYAEDVTTDCKLALLTVFQEEGLVFLSDSDRLEETVWSLNGLYQNLHQKDGLLLRSKILTTITSMLLTCDTLVYDEVFKELLDKHIQLLVNCISKPKKEAVVVRIAASQCLEEIEAWYPCVLQVHLESLWLSCQNDTSAVSQFSACLLSLIVRNVICRSDAQKHSAKEVAVPLSSKNLLHQHSIIDFDPLPVAMYCLDLLPSISPLSAALVLRHLMTVVKMNVSHPLHIFRMWFPRLSSSFFIPWLHISMEMQDLLNQHPVVTKQLFQLQKHPLLSTAHRLLVLDWLESCLQQKDIGVNVCRELKPSPFDGCDTHSKKIKILAHRKETPFNLLIKCLEGLFKNVKHGGRPAVVFFQTLYTYFCTVQSPELIAHANRSFLNLIELAPRTIMPLMDFIACVRKTLPKSMIAEGILGSALNHILAMPSERCLEKLDWYLQFIQRVCVEKPAISRPKDSLHFLQRLLNLENVRNDWALGNTVLSTIFCILQNQDIQQIYTDVGDILYMLMTQSEDVDICSRSKLYYSAMMSMAPEKVKEIFEAERKIDIEHLEPGRSTYPLAAPIHQLPTGIITVARIASGDSPIGLEKDSLKAITSFSDYLELLNNDELFNKKVRVKFYLKIEDGFDENFKKLFGIVLHIHSNTSVCSATERITIPILIHRKDFTFSVELIPMMPQPLRLHFSVEFSTSSYESYSSELVPQVIQIQDLFLPLPVPSDRRAWLFEQLWDYLLNKGHYTVTTYSVPIEELVAKCKNCVIDEGQVGIFLPPSSHLLLKLVENNCISVATDNLSVLPWLYNFVHGLDVLM